MEEAEKVEREREAVLRRKTEEHDDAHQDLADAGHREKSLVADLEGEKKAKEDAQAVSASLFTELELPEPRSPRWRLPCPSTSGCQIL